MRNSGVVSTTILVLSVTTYIEGRVRWFFGFARNSGAYSLPMIGTPCEVPEPRNVNSNAMRAHNVCGVVESSNWKVSRDALARHAAHSLQLVPVEMFWGKYLSPCRE